MLGTRGRRLVPHDRGIGALSPRRERSDAREDVRELDPGIRRALPLALVPGDRERDAALAGDGGARPGQGRPGLAGLPESAPAGDARDRPPPSRTPPLPIAPAGVEASLLPRLPRREGGCGAGAAPALG